MFKRKFFLLLSFVVCGITPFTHGADVTIDDIDSDSEQATQPSASNFQRMPFVPQDPKNINHNFGDVVVIVGENNGDAIRLAYDHKGEVNVKHSPQIHINQPPSISDWGWKGLEQGVIQGIAMPVARTVDWAACRSLDVSYDIAMKATLFLQLREKSREEFVMEINKARQKEMEIELKIKDLETLGHATEEELQCANMVLELHKEKTKAIEKKYTQSLIEQFKAIASVTVQDDTQNTETVEQFQNIESFDTVSAAA